MLTILSSHDHTVETMIDKLENMFDSLTDWCLSNMDLRDVEYRVTLL